MAEENDIETTEGEAPEAKEAAKPAAKPRARKPKAETAEAKAEPKAAAEKPAAKKPAAKKPAAKKAPAAKPAARSRQAAEPSGGERVVVRAQAKYVRTSARKARLVCDHIRGKSVTEARAILAFAPRAVARDWSKLLESAVANAEHNNELDIDDLRITEVYADEGPTIKRFRPRAMGRATKIRKRTAHLTIKLTPKG